MESQGRELNSGPPLDLVGSGWIESREEPARKRPRPVELWSVPPELFRGVRIEVCSPRFKRTDLCQELLLTAPGRRVADAPWNV